MTVDAPTPRKRGSRRYLRTATPLGDMVLAARDDALAGAYFDGQKHLPQPDWFGKQVHSGADTVLDQAAAELDEYFGGERQAFTVLLAPHGTAFQQRVWELLVGIDYGETTSYGALSAALSPDGTATPGLAQGVGQAVGHNPISILVPCHRVVGADGSLTGFAGGLDRKRWLLAHEEPESVTSTRLF